MSMSTNIHLNSASEVEFGASKLLDSSTKELICYTLDLKCENGQVTSFMTLEQMQELSETINKLIYPIKMPYDLSKVEGGVINPNAEVSR